MRAFHRLDRKDGSFFLVEAPTFDRAHQIRAYHLELLALIAKFDYAYLPQTDPVLFENFAPYYEAIAHLLKPRFDPAQLTPSCRHAFFIATDLFPAAVADSEEPTLILGLSNLETLMGYQLPKGSNTSQAGVIRLTSGDDDADLVAALLLCFKFNALEMTRRYARQDLINILKQAQNLLRGEEAIDELQRERDRELFEKNQAEIEAQFRKLGAPNF